MKKKIKDLTDKEKLTILSYEEIDKNFGNRRYHWYVTKMEGNMFFLSREKKNLFGKVKYETRVCLCCCCGVRIQTFIDILKAYNFDLNYEIEFEVLNEQDN
jgi:hypothetical protein